jgi:hypothetical protein
MDDETCVCGHVLDEHNTSGFSCEVDGCLCAYFEPEESEDDD